MLRGANPGANPADVGGRRFADRLNRLTGVGVAILRSTDLLGDTEATPTA
jgi:hypothetical protein